ncbi:MAG: hypothetical protein RLZZ387_1079 [Chloroflexota bacterium]
MDEPARVEALHGLGILDTPPEERFNRLTRLACQLFDVPIALISLVDTDRQWFKACHGLSVSGTSREVSFCAHVVSRDAPLVVPDARTDPRFRDNPLVQSDPHIRFYAGHPIHSRSGYTLGTLCIIDRTPRTLTSAHQDSLRDLALLVEAEVNLQLQADADTALALTVTQSVAASRSFEAALQIVLREVCSAVGWRYGEAWVPDHNEGLLRLSPVWHAGDPGLAAFREASLPLTFARGEGLPGRAWATGRAEWIADITHVNSALFLRIAAAATSGLQAGVAIPVVAGDEVLAMLTFLTGEPRPEDERQVRLISLLAGQLGPAFQRARAEERVRLLNADLERRVEERTVELASANQALRAAHDEMRGINEQLAAALRMKDEFLASMSHELRTPLNAVLGVTSALEEGVYGSVNERQKRALDVITESGQHLLSLIADVLDLARLQAEQLSLRLAPVDLEEICAASLRLVQPSAQKRRIMLVSTRGGSTSMVVADARRLKQVLVNLLANAVKFTPEGGTVGLEVSSDEAERVVRFAVWDTGIGITPEDQARVFEPFVQVDSGLTRQYEGTGLGLALVTRLVALHGGTVAVESEPGQGSRFTITLPWRTPDPHDFARSAEQTAHTEHPGASPDTPRPLVLIVEDNTANSTLMSDYLRAYGLEVAVAKEGLEALREAKRLRPAVIVMDIQLPGMDGIEVTRRIKADASLGHTRVIAVTAMAMVGDRERCLEAGADDYLCKPVRLAELHTRVSELAMAGRRP